MIEIILTPCLHLIIVSLFLLIAFKNTSLINKKPLLLFYLIYFFHYFLTFLPIKIDSLQIIKLPVWNWSGKLFSMLFVLLVLAFMKNKRTYFIPPNLKIKKTPLILILMVFLLTNFWLFPFLSLDNANWNTFFFQLTLPSISEELLFRSLLLGLLFNHISPINKYSHLNYFIISLLFGLGHSLFIHSLSSMTFQADNFLNAFLFGYFWTWLTHKSKSVFYAMSSHSLSNILQAFV